MHVYANFYQHRVFYRVFLSCCALRETHYITAILQQPTKIAVLIFFLGRNRKFITESFDSGDDIWIYSTVEALNTPLMKAIKSSVDSWEALTVTGIQKGQCPSHQVRFSHCAAHQIWTSSQASKRSNYRQRRWANGRIIGYGWRFQSRLRHKIHEFNGLAREVPIGALL